MNLHLEALTAEGRALWARLPEVSEGYYLAGGTALALQLNHRISLDFDFFSERHIPRTQLAKIENVFKGYTIVPRVNNRDELTVFMGAVKISFISYPFRAFLPFVEEQGIQLLSPKEIAVTKAYTIGRRGEWKDYVDFYSCLANGIATLAEVIGYAQKKYDAAFSDRLFLEQLVYFDDIDETQKLNMKVSVSRDTVQAYFKHAIADLHLAS